MGTGGSYFSELALGRGRPPPRLAEAQAGRGVGKLFRGKELGLRSSGALTGGCWPGAAVGGHVCWVRGAYLAFSGWS